MSITREIRFLDREALSTAGEQTPTDKNYWPVGILRAASAAMRPSDPETVVWRNLEDDLGRPVWGGHVHLVGLNDVQDRSADLQGEMSVRFHPAGQPIPDDTDDPSGPAHYVAVWCDHLADDRAEEHLDEWEARMMQRGALTGLRAVSYVNGYEHRRYGC